ncbi:hypothetical protein [Acidisphaera sp. S103]|uniref:hypothetical protein n=1 Tax=Acidisphaera sp. S103 TaxID=1747223 RepID=UPI00131A8B06|nr:hypothetical protein [Acidisphaera sp. S103]
MIKYKFPEEQQLLIKYASRLGDEGVVSILARGAIESETDARLLSRFFWRMVDSSLNDDIEVWHERIHNTLFAALRKAGYSEIWDEEIPDA